MQKLTKKIILTSLTTLLFIGCASKPKPVYSYEPPIVPIKITKYSDDTYDWKWIPRLKTFFGIFELEDS